MKNAFNLTSVFFALLVCIAIPDAMAVRGDDVASPANSNQPAAAANPRPVRRPLAAQTNAFGQLQKEDAGVSLEWDTSEGTPSVIRGKGIGSKPLTGVNPSVSKAVFQGAYSQRSLAVMDNLAPLYRIKSAKQEFVAKQNEELDELGFRHQRLEQVYQGIPVVGGDVTVHFDAQNNPYQVNGKYVPDLALNVVPSITADQAVESAKNDFVAKAATTDVIALMKGPDLVVYALGDSPVLAYQLEIRTRPDNARKYWVDAQTGAVIRSVSAVCKIAAPTKTGGVSAGLSGTRMAGEGGAVVNWAGWSQNSVYYMYDPTNYYFVWNANNSSNATAPTTPTVNSVQAAVGTAVAADSFSSGPTTAVMQAYSDPSTYAYRSTTNWGTSDTTEVSTAVNMSKVFEYYRLIHNRNGVNGANGAPGKAVAAVVHFDKNYVNAYWDGTAMYFGDGDNTNSTSLAVLDVCGHELTHGVTEYSANLNYQDESGALNESFSDVMGATIEFYAQADGRSSYPNDTPGSADWKLGEDCWLDGSCLRDMRNPASTNTMSSGYQQPTKYGGKYWQNYKTDTSDNGGVHQNSGVQNFFYYLLCDGGSGTNDGLAYNVTGIGITNARLVAYRALTVYCTTTTDYNGARTAWVSAASDLNPSWVSSVRAAWSAVGVAGSTPVITSATTARGASGSAFSYQIVATQTPTSYAATGLPSGLTVDTSTGLISGTPVQTGTFNASISASNADGTGTANLQITILPPDTGASFITSFSPASGSPGSLVVLTGGNMAGATSVTFNGAAAAFTVDSANQITATVPASASTGKISVSNSFGAGFSSADFQVIPVVLNEDFATLTSGSESSPSSTEVTANLTTNFPTSVKAYSAGGAVKLGSSSAVGSITSRALNLSANGGVFSVRFDVKGWTTVEGSIKVTVGSLTPQTVSYTATSSDSYESKFVNFTGGQANSTVKIETTAKRAFIDNVVVTSQAVYVAPPVINSSLTASATAGTAFNYSVTATENPTSFGATGLPDGLSINTATGVISGTPTTAGTSSVTISATNAGGTGSATLVLTVSNPPPPVISSQLTASGVVGTAFNYQIAASNSPASFGATGLPGGLSVNTTTGAITGTPTTSGTFNVTISATNPGGTDSKMLVVTINVAPPVISSAGTASGIVGSDFSYQITASGSPTSYGASNLPAGLSVDTGTGLISGTPTAAGTSSATITATNAGGTGSKSLVISITPSGGTSGVLAGWDVSGQANYGVSPLVPTIYATNFVSVGGLTRSAAIGTLTNVVMSAARAWGGYGWTNTNAFASFSLTVAAGYKMSLTNISVFDYRRPSTGPTNGAIQYSTNGTNFVVLTNLTYSVATSSGGSLGPINLSGVAGLQDLPGGTTVTFRIVNTGATATNGAWYIFDKSNTSANDLEISGAIAGTNSGPAPIIAATGSLGALNSVYGISSTNPGSFTLTGSNLTTNAIVVAPNGFEISQTAGGASGYASSQTIAPSSGVVSNTIYVRLSASAVVGTYFGDILLNSAGSAGATVAIPSSTVAKKDISVTGLTGVSKVYDGTASATFTGTAAYSGLVNGESFAVSGSPSASFVSAAAGTGKTINVTGYNAPSGNYNLLPTTLTADITPKSLAIAGVSGVSKIYDGTSAASLSGTPSLSGVETMDNGNVSVGGIASALFASPNVGVDIALTVSGYTLTGSAAANYSAVQPEGLTADITPRSATVTASDRVKIYGTAIELGINQRSGFVATGLAAGEKVDKVTLTASGGTAIDDPVGTYAITPSEAAAAPSIPVNPFRADNYDITYVGGTLSVTESGPPTFEQWMSTNYPQLTGGDATAAADPDKDGIANLLEYYMGLNPVADNRNAISVSFTPGSPSSLSMSYRRSKNTTNVVGGVSWISTLSTNNNWSTNGVTENVIGATDYDDVTATVTNGPSDSSKFLRLKVQQQ